MSRRLICFAVIGLSLLSCSEKKKVYSFSGPTMGTTYSIKIASEKTISTSKLQLRVNQVLQEVNRQMSTYDIDSEISRVNKSGKNVKIPISDWFYKVLESSLALSKETDGFFDPTLGPLVNLWGFGPKGERRRPDKSRLQKVRQYVGHDKLKLSQTPQKQVSKSHGKVYVDLSAIAKGFAVDKLSEFLQKKGFQHHLVEVGGEMRAHGNPFDKKWRIAVERPDSGGRSVQAVLELSDVSIATSGSYRNFFEEKGRRYSHTINFKTGEPIRHHLLSVSVLDTSCMRADALATALMAMGPDRAWDFAQKRKMSVYLIFKNDKKEKVEVRATEAFRQYLVEGN